MAPSEEDFQIWLDNPVTVWIMKGCQKAAKAQKEHWLTKSWEGGEADPMLLKECATRADAYKALIETTYEGWCEVNEDNPETD